MASLSSARSVLSAIRNTFVASHLTSYLATTGIAATAQRTVTPTASRRNVSASASKPASNTPLATGGSAERGEVGTTVGRHQLVTVELISDTM